MAVSGNGPGGWLSGWRQAASNLVTKATVLAATAATVTQKIYRVAVNTVLPAIVTQTSNAYTATVTIAKHLAGSTAYATDIGKRIIFNWNQAVDSSNGVQKLDVDDRVKERYAKVMPYVVKQFHDRFGPEAMLQMDQFTTVAQKHIPGPIGLVLNSICPDTVRVDVQTIAMGTVTFVADKLQKTLPDGDVGARKALAAELAQDMASITRVFQEVKSHVRKNKKLDWDDPAFVELYDTELAKRALSTSLGTQNEFYTKLADRLLKRVESELPEHIEPHLRIILEAISEGTEEIWPNKKRDLLASLLMELHQVITDPTQVKSWLVDILNLSSESLEQQYQDFLSNIDHTSWWIPFSSFFNVKTATAPQSVSYDSAYGKVIMRTLLTLRPKAFGADALGIYSWLNIDKIEKGKDFLSVLLRDSTGASIESLMSSSTDAWLKSAIKIVKMNLLTDHGELITRPGYIPEADWDLLTPPQRLEACQKGSHRYNHFKTLHIKKIDAMLAESTERIAKGVFRAGMIIEQFLPRAIDVANNEYKNPVLRSFAGAYAFIRELPVIHFLANCFHRLSIYIREIFADKTSRSTAQSLHKRLNHFLETDSINLLGMHMMERTLDRLQLLAPKSREEDGFPTTDRPDDPSSPTPKDPS